MTAPARTAAFHALRAIADGTRRPCRPRSRRAAASVRRARPRAGGGNRHRHAALAAQPRLPRRAFAGAADRRRSTATSLHILRLSLYQLLHLDRVPASAVVDDAVDLTRQAQESERHGFRQRGAALDAAPAAPPAAAAAAGRTSDREAALGVPGHHALASRLAGRALARRYGFDAAERWVRFNNETPRLTLRANTPRVHAARSVAASLGAADVETEPTRYAPDGLVVTAGNPLRLRGGWIVLRPGRSVAARRAGVGAQPGERVLDLCASPGGKTVRWPPT